MFPRISCLFGRHARSRTQVWDDNLNLRSNCRYCGRDMIKMDDGWRLMTPQDEDSGREKYPTTVSKERRLEPRHPARREALLHSSGTSQPVVVPNISAYGVMLIGRRFPPPGTHATLSIAGNDLVTTVAWNGDEKCGLMFHERIDPVTFTRLSSETERKPEGPERSDHV